MLAVKIRIQLSIYQALEVTRLTKTGGKVKYTTAYV